MIVTKFGGWGYSTPSGMDSPVFLLIILTMLLPSLMGLWKEQPLSLKGLDWMKVPYSSACYPYRHPYVVPNRWWER